MDDNSIVRCPKCKNKYYEATHPNCPFCPPSRAKELAKWNEQWDDLENFLAARLDPQETGRGLWAEAMQEIDRRVQEALTRAEQEGEARERERLGGSCAVCRSLVRENVVEPYQKAIRKLRMALVQNGCHAIDGKNDHKHGPKRCNLCRVLAETERTV